MAYGLEIRNPNNGAVILRITDRLTRVIGSFDTGTQSGSFAVPLLGSGAQTFATIEPGVTSYPVNQVLPQLAINGNIISWTFDNRTENRVSCRVTYGVY